MNIKTNLKSLLAGAVVLVGFAAVGVETTAKINMVKSGEPWTEVTVDYTLAGIRPGLAYKVAFDVTSRGVTRGVTYLAGTDPFDPNTPPGEQTRTITAVPTANPVLPAAPFRHSDGEIRPTRTIHFVLPTLSFRATDFLTIPTDFFFSAYGVIRTNHTAPDPPDFRIFAAPRPPLPAPGLCVPHEDFWYNYG